MGQDVHSTCAVLPWASGAGLGLDFNIINAWTGIYEAEGDQVHTLDAWTGRWRSGYYVYEGGVNKRMFVFDYINQQVGTLRRPRLSGISPMKGLSRQLMH